MSSTHSLAALRRVPTPMLIVGGLHLAVIWALLNGLQIHNAPSASPDDITVDMIKRPAPPPDRRQPPQVQPREIKFTEPQPPRIVVDPATTESLTQATFDDRPAPPLEFQNLGGSAEPQPVINAAAVDPHHPLTQPPYPMASRRLAEEGALVLNILVGPDGHVRDAKVSRSSGFERLDQAAVSEAKQHWRLQPAARNGVAFEQWLTLRVVFRLADR
jgi:periplasmic protein TonB